MSELTFEQMLEESFKTIHTGEVVEGKVIDVKPDEIVLNMAAASGQQILCWWHLLQKSRVAEEILPPVERLPLAQAVVQLLARMRDFDRLHRDDELLRIAEDGAVDPEELPQFKAIVRDLHGIIQAALQVDYAEKAE